MKCKMKKESFWKNKESVTIIKYFTFVNLMTLAAVFSSVLAARNIISYLNPVIVLVVFFASHYFVRKCTIKTLSGPEKIKFKFV